MSVAIQNPSPAITPKIHGSHPEIDTDFRGELPEGTTLEQVLSLIIAANLSLTLNGAMFLVRVADAIKKSQEQVAEKQNVMTMQAYAITVLATISAVGVGASGFGQMIAPMLQGINNQITADSVKAVGEGLSKIFDGGKEATKSVYDSDLAKIEADRNITESITLRAAQDNSSQMERTRETLLQAMQSIFQTKSKSN